MEEERGRRKEREVGCMSDEAEGEEKKKKEEGEEEEERNLFHAPSTAN